LYSNENKSKISQSLITEFAVKTVKPALPNPADVSTELRELVEVGNKIVSDLLVSEKKKHCRKGPYSVHTPEARFAIGKYATEHRYTKARNKSGTAEAQLDI